MHLRRVNINKLIFFELYFSFITFNRNSKPKFQVETINNKFQNLERRMILLLILEIMSNAIIPCTSPNQTNCTMPTYNAFYSAKNNRCNDEDCYKILSTGKCDGCRSDCMRNCQLRGYKNNMFDFMNQSPIIVPIQQKPETVTVIESQENAPVITVTHSEFKTVTVDPPAEPMKTSTRKRKRRRDPIEPEQTYSDDAVLPKLVKLMIPKLCKDGSNCDKKEDGPVNNSDLNKLNDVTVTRVVEKTATIEKPFTLYREFTTTVTSEKPIINYKVTTFTSIQTMTETRFINSGEANNRSTRNTEYCTGENCQYRPTITINRCNETSNFIPPYNPNYSTVFNCIRPTLSKQPHSDSVKTESAVTVTVEKSSSPVSETIRTVTVERPLSTPLSTTEPAKTITVERSISAIPNITTTVTVEKELPKQSVSYITSVLMVTSTKEPEKKMYKPKGCEVSKGDTKPMTICRFRSVPKTIKNVNKKYKKPQKKKRTVFRTIFSTEKAKPSEDAKVVTKTVFE